MSTPNLPDLFDADLATTNEKAKIARQIFTVAETQLMAELKLEANHD